VLGPAWLVWARLGLASPGNAWQGTAGWQALRFEPSAVTRGASGLAVAGSWSSRTARSGVSVARRRAYCTRGSVAAYCPLIGIDDLARLSAEQITALFAAVGTVAAVKGRD